MVLRLPDSVRNAMVSAMTALADAGTGPAKLNIYSGGQPQSVGGATSATLLVTFTLSDPCYAAPSGGTAILDADPDISATAVATGGAGWARLTDSDDVTVYEGSVGTSASSEFVLNSTSITIGQTVTLTAGSFSVASGV